ncbi:MAG: menaquinone biosynthesis protein [Thermoleophilia bacterium]|nr:menaquinone biosynthesis protein [Thermoleophilia bacterium]
MTRPGLAVGRIAALNMYPLYHHLESAAGDRFAYTDGVPTALNRALLGGRIHVSAMSSIEFARNHDALRLLPVASITASGAVDSIAVFSRRPLGDLGTIAITPNSATSVALLRVLVGPGPRFVPQRGEPREALGQADGVLLIGDEALQARRSGLAPVATDLGALWTERTGLPMVFAVWAVRRDLDPALDADVDTLAGLLEDARRAYDADPEAVVAAAARRFPFPAPYVSTYLARLSYGFGSRERDALAAFYDRAVEAGELARVPALAA